MGRLKLTKKSRKKSFLNYKTQFGSNPNVTIELKYKKERKNTIISKKIIKKNKNNILFGVFIVISVIGYIYCDTYVKGIKRQPEQKWQPRYTQEEWQQIEIERNSEQFVKETAQEFETETVAEPSNSIEEETQTELETKYTENDFELLAHVIEAEAGGESDYHKLCVGTVVMNRVDSEKYPNSIEGVIYQPGQYQCVTNSHINKEPSESSYEAAKSILDGRRMFRSSVVYQAEFIQGKVVEKVGNTYFCEDED